MTKDFQLSIKTPRGSSQVEANSWADLVKMVPKAVSLLLPEAESGDRIDREARLLLRVYRDYFDIDEMDIRRSPILQAGLELDLARRFILKNTAKESVEWLAKNRQFNTSESSVGRYWRKFRTAYRHHRRSQL